MLAVDREVPGVAGDLWDAAGWGQGVELDDEVDVDLARPCRSRRPTRSMPEGGRRQVRVRRHVRAPVAVGVGPDDNGASLLLPRPQAMPGPTSERSRQSGVSASATSVLPLILSSLVTCLVSVRGEFDGRRRGSCYGPRLAGVRCPPANLSKRTKNLPEELHSMRIKGLRRSRCTRGGRWLVAARAPPESTAGSKAPTVHRSEEGPEAQDHGGRDHRRPRGVRRPVSDAPEHAPAGQRRRSSEFLASEAKKYGFKTRILELETGDPTVPTVRVVEAVKQGTTKPDEWIAFIAHYDTVEQTVQGAYDDGSGTNIMRYFAKAFSKVKTNRSIALLWFDGEEQGLLASDIYAEQLAEKGQKIHGRHGLRHGRHRLPGPLLHLRLSRARAEDAANGRSRSSTTSTRTS